MITSTKNKAVSRIRGIKNSASGRRKEGVFIAEGTRLVGDIASCAPQLIERLYYCDRELIPKGLDPGTVLEEVAPHVMEAMSDTGTPQGVLATVYFPSFNREDVIRGNPLILILDNIRDPGNMGTMIRTFEAASGTGMILVGDCTDPFSPKCVRATMGSIVRMPIIKSKMPEELTFLREAGVTLWAADLYGEDYVTADFRGPTAFIIGSEAGGISSDILDVARGRLNIPMGGGTESLNAAVTAAILSFEAAAQRRKV